MAQQTAVEWLLNEFELYYNGESKFLYPEIIEQAKEMELNIRKEDFKIGYNRGYLDAQCNHVNDADNFASEQEYLNDKEITDYTIGPFGTPEKI
jgi:hypothetical protein